MHKQGSLQDRLRGNVNLKSVKRKLQEAIVEETELALCSRFPSWPQAECGLNARKGGLGMLALNQPINSCQKLHAQAGLESVNTLRNQFKDSIEWLRSFLLQE